MGHRRYSREPPTFRSGLEADFIPSNFPKSSLSQGFRRPHLRPIATHFQSLLMLLALRPLKQHFFFDHFGILGSFGSNASIRGSLRCICEVLFWAGPWVQGVHEIDGGRGNEQWLPAHVSAKESTEHRDIARGLLLTTSQAVYGDWYGTFPRPCDSGLQNDRLPATLVDVRIPTGCGWTNFPWSKI